MVSEVDKKKQREATEGKNTKDKRLEILQVIWGS